MIHDQRTVERFQSKIQKGDSENSCWIWLGAKHIRGYGYFGVSHGKNVYAHRFSYEISHGPIPDGMCIMHKCDNPSCVRPDHLQVGTQKDNIRDRDQKKRTATGKRSGVHTKPENFPTWALRGENNDRACLTQKEAEEIRELFSSGSMKTDKLALKYGVGRSTIYRVIRREVYP